MRPFLLLLSCTKSVESSPTETGPTTTVPYVTPPPEVETIPVLGSGTHDTSTLQVLPIVNPADGIVDPRDVAFNTGVDDLELWIVNGDDSIVIYENPGTDIQVPVRIDDAYAWHAMDHPSAIAFGYATVLGNEHTTFATCHESRNEDAGSDDRMGPTLWLADPEVLGIEDPNGLGSHLAQVHESPLCMGLAWEVGNAYWAFDGDDGALVRYDFGDADTIGDDDVSGATVARYAADLERVPEVPAGVVYDGRQTAVYVSDSGHGLVKRLDASSGKRGEALPSRDVGTDHFRVDGGEVTVLVDGAKIGLERPSGLDLYDDLIFVGDHATGVIWAFDLDGVAVDWLDTGLGPDSIRGFDVRSLTELWVVDGASADVYVIRSEG